MNKVFISYSSKEYDEAGKFRTAFTEHELECWMAPESIPGGSNYAVEIPKAIQDCSAFVLMLSDNSQKSIWVKKEIDLAISLNKPIFPIALDTGLLISPFDFYLTNVQITNAPEGAERIAGKLKHMLSDESEIENMISAASSQMADKKKFNIRSKKEKVVISLSAAAVIAAAVGIGAVVFSNQEAVPTVGHINGIDKLAEIMEIDENCNFKLSFGKLIYIGTYSGEMNAKGAPEGKGTFKGVSAFETEMLYIGNFSGGFFSGDGQLTLNYTNGDVKIYNCNFKDGEPEGEGTYTYTYVGGGTETYTGNFKDGQATGKGKRTKADPSWNDTRIAEGYFVNGKMEGECTATNSYQNGETSLVISKGKFKNDCMDGYGVKTYSYKSGDQMVYEGEFSNNEFIGENNKMTYTYADRTKFISEGEFKRGALNGQGQVTCIEGDTTLITGGEYEDGVLKVQKIYSFTSGDGSSKTYNGEFKDGKYNGHGVYSHTDTDGGKETYNGEYKDGKYNGKGVYSYTYANGNEETYNGEYKNGSRNGHGVYSLTLKDKFTVTYDGNFKMSNYDGEGKLTITYKDGTVEVHNGNFKDGEFVG